jgi:hypothetical protein
LLSIALRQAHSPEEMTETNCAICTLPFEVQSVVADVGGIIGGGSACRSCVIYLGIANPERSPTIEEFEEALALYPKPLFGSEREIKRVEAENPDAAMEAVAAAWIS